jgi:subtilase family serine protease
MRRRIHEYAKDWIIDGVFDSGCRAQALWPRARSIAQCRIQPQKRPTQSIHGALASQPNAAPISVTVVLSLSDLGGAENLLKAINAPGDPQYHKFLTAEEFVGRFAPSAADVMPRLPRV